MKNNIRYKGNTNNTSVIIFLIGDCPSDVNLLGRTPSEVFVMLVVVVLHFVVVVLHSILFFILLLLFFFSFLLNIIPHPSVDYRRVFKPILYFQPSPWQGDSRHFHFNLSEIFSGHFFTHRHFFILHSFTNILPAFIKASLGAGSSSLKFSGLHTDDPRNTDLSHLFV